MVLRFASVAERICASQVGSLCGWADSTTWSSASNWIDMRREIGQSALQSGTASSLVASVR
jgi:hypothetical protein